jgi:hypothetical protein
MFDSTILDVVIGIVFVFLLFGLVVSWMKEAVASTLKIRAKQLKKYLSAWLGEKTTTNLYEKTRIKTLYQKTTGKKWEGGPSYIDPKFFASALIEYTFYTGESSSGSVLPYEENEKNYEFYEKRFQDLIKNVEDKLAEENSPFKDPLVAYLRSIKEVEKKYSTRISKAREEMETWFNLNMDRLSGYYKRHIWRWGFFMALIIGLLANIDSIAITKALLDNQKLQSIVVTEAIDYYQAAAEVQQTTPEEDVMMSGDQPAVNGEEAEGDEFGEGEGEETEDPLAQAQNAQRMAEEAISALQELDLPIGWTLVKVNATDPDALDPYSQSLKRLTGFNQNSMSFIAIKFSGIFISAFAAAHGSEIWFDLLKMLINVRGTGPNPKEEEEKKSRRESKRRSRRR